MNWCECSKFENGQYILEKNSCKIVGKRDNIFVWEDPWIPNISSFVPSPREVLGISYLVENTLDFAQWYIQELKDFVRAWSKE